MKNASITLIMLCLTCTSAGCQVPPHRIPLPCSESSSASVTPPRDFPLEPQWYARSCWAATLSMASKYIARDSVQMNQCYFVDQLFPGADDDPYCGCETNMSDEIVSLSGATCDNIHTTSGTDNLYRRFGLAQSINTNAKQVIKSIDLSFLRCTLKEGNPVIHSYKFQENSGETGKHVYLISGIESPRRKKLRKSFNTNLLLVKDPWPETEGAEYYMTYEQFYFHKEQENIFFSENLPNLFPQPETVGYMKNTFMTSNATSALTAAKRFVSKLKKMDPNSVSIHFLEKSGIQESLARISVYPSEIDVEEIDSDGLLEIPLANSDTLRSFGNTDRMFFLTDGLVVKSVLTVSKRTFITDEIEYFTDKWFISRLEKADKYQDVYNLLLLNSLSRFGIFRYKGKASGEILAKQSPIKNRYIKVKVLSKKFNVAKN